MVEKNSENYHAIITEIGNKITNVFTMVEGYFENYYAENLKLA